MEELNNWDEDTIKHLIHKLQLDAETAELIANRYQEKESNLRPENFLDSWIMKQEATRHYGQANAYHYTVAYLREMLDDNAKAIAQVQQL